MSIINLDIQINFVRSCVLSSITAKTFTELDFYFGPVVIYNMVGLQELIAFLMQL
jgi:hypothetical protein